MPTAFHALTIAQIRQETADAISVQFAVPQALAGQFRFAPGQHLTLRAEVAGEELRRSYSLCSSPADTGLRIAIKRVPDGRFSNWAADNLKVGAVLSVMPPAGSFCWSFASTRRAQYAMFAAGSGITPILSLLKTGLAEEPGSHFALFYGNRETASILFLEELAQLKNRYLDRFEVHHFLSREEDELQLLNGRIDAAKMAEILAGVLPVRAIDAAFVCGPGAMMDCVEAALVEGGLDPAMIKSERFCADELSAARREEVDRLEQQAAGKPIKVTINGKRRALNYDAARESILENARAAGLPAPFACKAGVCATCRARIVRGKVEMIRNFGLTEDELARGYILTCQAIPLSDDVEIDFDA